MTTKEFLIKVRELLSDPNHWTKGHFAKDNKQVHVSVISDNASCYCLHGAMQRIHFIYDKPNPKPSPFNIVNNLTPNGTIFYNDADTTTHQDILNLLEKAIESCQSSNN